MLNRYADILDQLMVFPDRMLENIHLTKGLVFSQRVLTALIDGGFSREDAYDLVQNLALQAFRDGSDFKSLVNDNPLILSKLSKVEIEELFNLEYYQRNIDYIYNQVFSNGE
jgi:adenylosuccinate lyase